MPDEQGPRGLRRAIYIELSAVGIVLGLVLLWTLRHLLLEVLVGLVLAVVAEPAVKLLVRAQIRRSMSVVLVFVLLLVAVVVVLFFLSVPIYDAAIHFVNRLPVLIRDLKTNRGQLAHLVVQLNLEKYLQSSSVKLTDLASKVASPAYLAARQLLSTIVNLATIFILAVFLSLDGPLIIDGVLGLLNRNRAAQVGEVLSETARSVTRYMLGNLFTSVIAGLVVGISLAILGVPYAGVLAIWVGVVDFLPLVGGLLAGVPTVLVALLHSTFAAVAMLVIFLAYQQIENHILNPWVFSRAVALNPLWILLAVLIGAQLASVEGAIMAIPVASALQVIARAIWRDRTQRRLLQTPTDPG